ncbi:MAG: DUF1844 domain-containing protein [Candidatus Aminicenantes bacterium]|nr:DUF1844 domain-containing protein [Candidatus Aminicenantes bacterium]
MANKDKNSKKTTYKESKEPLPPLDFSSIVFPFFTQALIKLGQIKDPTINKEEENLVLAKRLIDLLELLNERTKGNLKPEEEKFLSSCLHQLRMAYLEKANIIKL